MNKTQVKQKSDNTFFDNDEGLINPAEHRDFNNSLVDSVLFKDDTSDVSSKTTPVDVDALLVADSADGNKVKKTTWANIKAALLTYFTTTFAKLTHTHTPAGIGAQPVLVSGSNIKTFYGQSIIGAGNLVVDLSTNWQNLYSSRGQQLYFRKNKLGLVEIVFYLYSPYEDFSVSDVLPVGFRPNDTIFFMAAGDGSDSGFVTYSLDSSAYLSVYALWHSGSTPSQMYGYVTYEP